MLNLLKYEFRKTRFSKLVLLALTLLAQIFFIYSVKTDKYDMIDLSALLLFFLTIGGIMFLGIQSVMTLHRDMNTSQSYMLFLTPHSTYSILGAKVLECFVSLAVAALVFFGLGYWDTSMILNEQDQVKLFLNTFKSILGMFSVSFSLSSITAFFVFLVTDWLLTIVVAYMSDILASSLLKGKKGGLCIAFIIFIVVTYLLGKLTNLIPKTNPAELRLFYNGIVSLVFSVIIYFVSARTMEKYLSV